MKEKLKAVKFVALLMVLAGITFSCKDDEAAAPAPVESSNAPINRWIYSQLEDVYLWNEELPERPDLNQDPTEFFDGLLYSGDRFSHIFPDYQKLLQSLNGVSLESGYELILVQDGNSSTDLVGMVLYVKDLSPAKEAGLRRGDVIRKINGNQLTRSNYRDLLGEISSTHELTYSRFDEDTDKYIEQPSVSLNAVELAENPSFMDSVYTVGSHKVGYYVYNFFSPGTTDAKEYDSQMDQIISGFKSKGVTDLVLDLRYNSGGAISSATNLASLVGAGVDNTKIFYENRWNSNYQEYIEGLPNGDQILRGRFRNKPSRIGDNLSGGRVYVLVGDRSASASELVINGLLPYMDVFLIGEKTVGKNVGSIALEDEDNPDNKYGMLPIVLQIHNSLGSSDYSAGFTPDLTVDELQFPLHQLGDVREPLLAAALETITGSGARKGMESARVSGEKVVPVASTIDRKAHTNRLIMDAENLK